MADFDFSGQAESSIEARKTQQSKIDRWVPHYLRDHVDVDLSDATVGYVMTRAADGSFYMAPGGSGGGGGGEANIGTNVGSGTGIYQEKVGVALEFKSLVAGTNLTFDTGNPDQITLNATGGSGEVNTIANVGAGVGIFQTKVGSELRLHSLIAGSGMSIVDDGDTLTMSTTGSVGEANTASNQGGGVGFYKTKTGLELEFKSLVAGTGVTLTPATDTVTIDVTGGGTIDGGQSTSAGGSWVEVYNGESGSKIEIQPLRTTGTILTIAGDANGITLDIATANLPVLVDEATPALGANMDLAGFEIRDGGNQVIHYAGGSVYIAGEQVMTISSPATGDMAYYDGAIWNKLAVGTNGDVMQLTAGIPAWIAPGSLSGVDADTLDGIDSTGFALASHNHAASAINSGTFDNALIAESNVTQHVAAIDHDGLLNFAANEHFTEASIDHGSIGGLTDDHHEQYALLAGRSGGQIITGGTAAANVLELRSTSNASKGAIRFGTATTTAYSEVTDTFIVRSLDIDGCSFDDIAASGVAGDLLGFDGTDIEMVEGITTNLSGTPYGKGGVLGGDGTQFRDVAPDQTDDMVLSVDTSETTGLKFKRPEVIYASCNAGASGENVDATGTTGIPLSDPNIGGANVTMVTDTDGLFNGDQVIEVDIAGTYLFTYSHTLRIQSSENGSVITAAWRKLAGTWGSGGLSQQHALPGTVVNDDRFQFTQSIILALAENDRIGVLQACSGFTDSFFEGTQQQWTLVRLGD